MLLIWIELFFYRQWVRQQDKLPMRRVWVIITAATLKIMIIIAAYSWLIDLQVRMETITMESWRKFYIFWKNIIKSYIEELSILHVLCFWYGWKQCQNDDDDSIWISRQRKRPINVRNDNEVINLFIIVKCLLFSVFSFGKLKTFHFLCVTRMSLNLVLEDEKMIFE